MNRRTVTLALASSFLVPLLTLGCQHSTVHGDDGTAVTVTTPRSITVKRGSSALLVVGIDRERFSGPVSVELGQLPDGVTADNESRSVETTSTTFVLEASHSAALVRNHSFHVTLEANDGHATTQEVTLSVVD